MNLDEVRKDIELAKKHWVELRPGMSDRDMSLAVCLLASRAEPLAHHAEELLDEIERLRVAARAVLFWRHESGAFVDGFRAQEELNKLAELVKDVAT